MELIFSLSSLIFEARSDDEGSGIPYAMMFDLHLSRSANSCSNSEVGVEVVEERYSRASTLVSRDTTMLRKTDNSVERPSKREVKTARLDFNSLLRALLPRVNVSCDFRKSSIAKSIASTDEAEIEVDLVDGLEEVDELDRSAIEGVPLLFELGIVKSINMN